MARFREAVHRRLGGGPTDPIDLVLAHIEEALHEDDASTQKAAFLVTALVHPPDMLEPVRRYFRELLDPLLSGGGDMNEVRHALLAVEGIFLLGGLGFVEVSPNEQKSVLLYTRYRRRRVGQASSVRPATLLDQDPSRKPSPIGRADTSSDGSSLRRCLLSLSLPGL
jgi:hypothetical protein